MSAGAVIVAAGSGTRAGLDPPKQYHLLDGIPVLAHTLNIFLTHSGIDSVVAVIAEAHVRLYADSVAPHLMTPANIVIGGASRTESVRRGLIRLQPEGRRLVLIHDGVRPFLKSRLIDDILRELEHTAAVVPALEVADALWKGDADTVAEPVRREGLMRVQTPQGFHLDSLLDAYRRFPDMAADDAAVAARAGMQIRIVSGSEDNVKLTRREDFECTRQALEKQMDIRVGNGFDTHKFCQGNEVVLCGVRIPHAFALAGHSDADVAAHAIADAIYGAVSEGDIGRWFPPTEAEWKNADSMTFLKHASALAAGNGFTIRSIDCTIICESPKITPYAAAMVDRLAGVLRLEAGRINVKATTTEGMGFTGRSEGIAALCSATLARQ
ncbi:MAG: bifunctional 2-C-methyl-D-erythritol 4-phosphate cytidylyltransferase/2-C-methyl-D-erythritol 2,4-cyclodiphosphate synthase [Rhodobacteraceae bacterium]|nr:bifunctional 2-C-methyl-D-erythritol 4-phosphate cytidylyltransferase/2-C-methyl-D-erythritol 2,4-cyclodiphosphate synthase [Paracoccaceae bacterium]